MKIILGLGLVLAAVAVALYFDIIGVKVNGVNWNSFVKDNLASVGIRGSHGSSGA